MYRWHWHFVAAISETTALSWISNNEQEIDFEKKGQEYENKDNDDGENKDNDDGENENNDDGVENMRDNMSGRDNINERIKETGRFSDLNDNDKDDLNNNNKGDLNDNNKGDLNGNDKDDLNDNDKDDLNDNNKGDLNGNDKGGIRPIEGGINTGKPSQHTEDISFSFSVSFWWGKRILKVDK
jgi:hypothetical protein